jgi:hypothetical protein
VRIAGIGAVTELRDQAAPVAAPVPADLQRRPRQRCPVSAERDREYPEGNIESLVPGTGREQRVHAPVEGKQPPITKIPTAASFGPKNRSLPYPNGCRASGGRRLLGRAASTKISLRTSAAECGFGQQRG